ncbi:NAD-dependent epimerase/dehydratase family protein [Shewanella sp. WPAGA9]|uniref:NAD-dependent epimerase/dehydratase family protein n=1 Tax=Shewanella sp. ENK2 TaxID=2775245 RepID=UPI00177CA495|nr:NAD-dependent epimerase/dehydratase family protein [Shewanella sp. WPAGA9]
MRILLTGSSGFVGKNLCDSMPTNTFVQVVRGKSESVSKYIYKIDQFNSSTDWGNAFEGVSAVIHLAGVAHNKQSYDTDFDEVNNKATLHLAREAVKSGIKRFVFVSSIGVNGASTSLTHFSATSNANPHNKYSQSKYNAEIGLKEIARTTGLEVVIVRPTLVYGVNAPGNFGLLTKLVTNLPFLPFGCVDNKRDFIAVQNLADLLITCAKHPNAAGHIFLASDGKAVSIKEFTNAIAKGVGTKLIQLPVPVSFMRLAGKLLGKSTMIEQLVGNLEVDSSNLFEVLDWTPPYTMDESMSFLKQENKEFY